MATLVSPDRIAAELADPVLRRVFAAVVLGASTAAQILAASGLGAPQAAPAIGRLARAGLLVQGRGVVTVDDGALAAAGERAMCHMADEAAADQPDPLLRGFISGGVLVRLPEPDDDAHPAALAHIAESVFTTGEYDERAVNERLRPWCEDGALDVLSLRRALVDAGFLRRESGRYRRSSGD
ncbi:hypothetical protein Afil01_40640 [Actinorhabdospora filicis]|uniref:DUF2087 domain-containing protein n=1 Tax=Actinorhabdospora filicis TaxID=1785913 RepID=A0A9W6SNQ7_9ACTN|nr:DUF2087 domain-containing protein [Actinorhabdospora filicis]GLZ79257.1 hypothetical protein Afil01_40640 [Actinorhabdospora filicis]